MKNFTKTIDRSPNQLITVDTAIKDGGFTIQVGDTTFVTHENVTKQITSGVDFAKLTQYQKVSLIMGTLLALSY